MMFQILPPLSDTDYAALKSDIAARGVMVPVEYDEQDNIIDGHHRVRICVELGIKDWPKIIRRYADDAAKRTQARKLNIARRHLDTAAKRALIEAELRDRPEVSNRAIAADLGVDHKTVAGARDELKASGEIPQFEKTRGRDGRERRPPQVKAVSLPGEDGARALKRAKGELQRQEIRQARQAYEERKEQGGRVEDLHILASSGKRFSVIYADPPWEFKVYSGKGKQRSAERHYDTTGLDDIAALPVEALAAPDCALFLWAVMPELPGALEIIKAWGFTYKTAGFTWAKQNRSGDGWFTGMGYWTRANAELCLLATRGSPQRLAMDVPQLIVAPVREHSRKPDEAPPRIERLLAGPYLELFARGERPGWTVWGNEIERDEFVKAAE